jgi:hypothetical protein
MMANLVEPHNWTDIGDTVLILRRISRDGTSGGKRMHNGKAVDAEKFRWPDGIGVIVTCPDWDARSVCGGGLHGWPWGMGLGEGCDYNLIDDRWLVLAASPSDVVGNIEGGLKCKCREAVKLYDGAFAGAWAVVNGGRHRLIEAMAKQGGNMSGQSATGYRSGQSATGNMSGQSATGDRSGQSATGDRSGQSATGYRSGQSATGNRSGQSATGYMSGALSTGESCTAEMRGESSAAICCGTGGRVRIGKNGAFLLAYDEGDERKYLAGIEGQGGIKRDVWYIVKDGKLVADENQG